MSVEKQAAVDWMTVLKTLLGGGLLGAGAGAGVSLARQIGDITDAAKAHSDSSKDDDILYVNIPKKASKDDANSAGTFAMAALGGLGGTYAGYNLIRSLVNKHRKKRLQAEIDQAQQAYIGGLQSTKEASGQFSGVSKLVGSGYLAGLLGILGSAIVTHKILQKQFPNLKSPNRGKPRKIVLRSIDPKGDEQGIEKTIQTNSDAVTPDAVEGIIRQNMANEKSASRSGFNDLVSAVAQGRADEIKNALMQGHEMDFVFDIVKGASLVKTSSVNRNLAISWLATDPLVSEVVSPLAAAEFYDWVPYCKVASYIEPKWHAPLIKLSEAITVESRKAIFKKVADRLPALVKKADGSPLIPEPLVQKLLVADALRRIMMDNQSKQNNDQAPLDQGGLSGDNSSNNTNSSVATSQDSTDQLDSNERPPTLEVDDKEAGDFVDNNKDVIDAALARTE